MSSHDHAGVQRLGVEYGYAPLARVLDKALDQAQSGKGKERHANAKPFLEQPIMEESRLIGPGGLIFQARKKILEAARCADSDPARAIVDLLGAINYTAAFVLLLQEQKGIADAIRDMTEPPQGKQILTAGGPVDTSGFGKGGFIDEAR